MERGGDAQGCVEGGLVTRHEPARTLERRLLVVRAAGRVIAPAAGVKNAEVLRVAPILRRVLPESGDRTQDQPGPRSLERCRIKTAACEKARRVVIDHNVGVIKQG